MQSKLPIYVSILMSVVPVHSQTTNDLVDMSIDQLLEVRISSASRSEKSIRELPASIFIVTSDEIEENKYFTLVDALKDLPGIKVSQPGTGTHGEKYLMRGLWGNNYAKIFVNGIPICPSGVDGMPIGEQINMRNVERIEVVYGPAAALYGADALSGIINIITKNPDENILVVDVMVGSSGFKQRDHVYSGTRFFTGTSKGSLRINLYGGFSERKDMNIKNDKSAFADSTLFGDVLSIGRLPSESHNLGLDLSYRDFQLSITDMYRADHSSLEQDSRYYLWDNSELRYGETIRTASLKHVLNISDFQFTSILSYLHYRLDNKSSFGMIFYPGQLYKFSASDDILFEETAVYNVTDNIELLAGFSMQYSGAMPKTNDLTKPFDAEDYHPFSTEVPETGVYQSATLGDFGFNPLTYHNIGVFTQGTFTNDLLTLTGGVRYDRHSEYENKVDPRIAALIHVSRKTSLRASYNQAFKAPTPYKVYNSIAVENSDGSIYYMHLPNKGMNPEKLSALEYGFRHLFSGDISAEIIGYRNKISALITSSVIELDPSRYPFADRDSSFIDVNSDDVESVLNGFDFIVNVKNIYKPKKVNLKACFSYARGRETLPNGDKIEVFRNMPKYLGKIRLSAEPVKHLYLGIDNTFCSEWYARVYSSADLDIPDRKSEGYYTMDLVGNYKFKTRHGTIGVKAKIINLFDASYGGYRYRDNPQYGRTLYGGIEVQL